MSYHTYQQAKNILLSQSDLADFAGETSIETIHKAENRLSLSFTGTYLDFLKTFGAGNFGAQEIFGIINDDFEHSSIPDGIWYTITERKELKLPHHLLVIFDSGFGELYCLDFQQTDDNGEPCVVAFETSVENNKQEYEIIAKDFGDFLYNLIMDENEN